MRRKRTYLSGLFAVLVIIGQVVMAQAANTVTVSSYFSDVNTVANRGSYIGTLGFKLTASPAASNLSQVEIHSAAGATFANSDITSCMLYVDNDADG